MVAHNLASLSRLWKRAHPSEIGEALHESGLPLVENVPHEVSERTPGGPSQAC